MARSGIIYYDNRLFTEAGVLAPSSEQPSFTREALQRDAVRDPLRFQPGWDVVTGVNNKIDFNRGGVKVATIAAGNYPTPTLYAAAVKAALQAADGTPTWTVAQNSATGIWTISTAAHAFTLLFATGTNRLASARLDLGMAVADTASASNAVPGVVSAFQGIKFVYFDQGGSVGWTIDASNDAIDFNVEGGPTETAYVSHGAYTSGVALTVAIRDALLVLEPSIDWAVNYDSGTQLFTIHNFTPRGGGGFTLFDLFSSSGPHVATGIWESIGFSTASDHTGNSIYSSDSASAGSVFDPLLVSFLLGHTFPIGSRVYLQADDSDLAAAAIEGAYDFEEDYQRDPDNAVNLLRLDFDTPPEQRYFRLVIDARATGSPTDSQQFLEISVWFMGRAFELPGLNPALSDTRQSLTTVTFAPGGQHTAVQRTSRRGYDLTIQLIDDDGRDGIEAILDDIGVGGMFFFDLDPNKRPLVNPPSFTFRLDKSGTR